MGEEEEYHPIYTKPKREEEYKFEKKHEEAIVLYKTTYDCLIGYAREKPEECIYIRFQSKFSYDLHPYILIINEHILEKILQRHKLKCNIEQFYEEVVRSFFVTKLYAYCFTTYPLEHGISTSTLPIKYKAKTSSTQWEKDGDYIVIQFKMEKERAIQLDEKNIKEKSKEDTLSPTSIITEKGVLERTISTSSVVSDLSSSTSMGTQANLTAKPYMFVLAGYHQKKTLKDIIPAVNVRFDEYKEIYEQQRINEEKIIRNRQKKYNK
mmetsp:Transcript_10331/g.15102  ORF Transcript_10331/g.15102 Transcript_10331/m.15102 type:complete len:266 (-) Transcript_10331:52-849(-)